MLKNSICLFLFYLINVMSAEAQSGFSTGVMTHFTYPIKGREKVEIVLLKNDTLKFTLFDNYLKSNSLVKLYDQRIGKDQLLALFSDTLTVIAIPFPINMPSGFYDLKISEGTTERKKRIVIMK